MRTGPEIHVITEGATEREVGHVLRERGILSKRAKPKPPDWRSTVGSREGYTQVINNLKSDKNPLGPLRSVGGKALLIFDQEDAASPEERKNQIEADLRSTDFWTDISFNRINGWNNLFEYHQNDFHIVLHISSADVEGVPRRDFDGYILQLLLGPEKESIATRLAPEGVSPGELLRKAEEELDTLMKRNGYPWTHSKSWLYAYITVFQFRQSHVWFAKRVVEVAPENELRRVFASLIEAWNRLAG
jgi:hypothetical protein